MPEYFVETVEEEKNSLPFWALGWDPLVTKDELTKEKQTEVYQQEYFVYIWEIMKWPYWLIHFVLALPLLATERILTDVLAGHDRVN